MKIECVQDEYVIEWYAHYNVFCEARQWCAETFGDNWGGARAGQFDRFFGSVNIFKFKRLYHAQWFVMRWDKFDK